MLWYQSGTSKPDKYQSGTNRPAKCCLTGSQYLKSLPWEWVGQPDLANVGFKSIDAGTAPGDTDQEIEPVTANKNQHCPEDGTASVQLHQHGQWPLVMMGKRRALWKEGAANPFHRTVLLFSEFLSNKKRRQGRQGQIPPKAALAPLSIPNPFLLPPPSLLSWPPPFHLLSFLHPPFQMETGWRKTVQDQRSASTFNFFFSKYLWFEDLLCI